MKYQPDFFFSLLLYYKDYYKDFRQNMKVKNTTKQLDQWKHAPTH